MVRIVEDMVGWKTVVVGPVTFHFVVDERSDIIWGFRREWYNGPWYTVGFGRFLQINW
jgi:hypothetical protein